MNALMRSGSVAARRIARVRLRAHAHARGSVEAPATSYVICTTPRSGSWLLSEGLAASGRAGNPREWFNELEEPPFRDRWRLAHASELPFEHYLAQAQAASTTSNGVCGLKLHFDQFRNLPRKLASLQGYRGLNSEQCLAKLLPRARFIWLSRRDKVRQAVSLLLAIRTGRWWSIDGVRPEFPLGDSREPEFDAEHIALLERQLLASDAGWQAHFRRQDITPLMVPYEDLQADYGGTVARVLEWLGVATAAAAPLPVPRLQRQSDDRNEAWVARYSNILHGLDREPAS